MPPYQTPTWDQFQTEQRHQRAFSTMGSLAAGLLQAGAQGRGVGEGLGYGLAHRGPRSDPMMDAYRYAQITEMGQKMQEREQNAQLLQRLLGYDASGGMPWNNPGSVPGYVPPSGPGAPAAAGGKGDPARDQSGQIVSGYRPMPAGARDVSGQTGTAQGGGLLDKMGLTPQQREIAAITLMRDPRSFGEVMSRFTAPQKAPDVVEAYDKDGRPQKHIWNAASGKYEPFGGSKADEGKAPVVHEFFNAKGQAYKAQWDGKKQDWVPVGFSKSETDKAPPTRTVHRGDRIITEEWGGGKWTEIADAPRFNPNSGVTPTTTANNDEKLTARQYVDKAFAGKPAHITNQEWIAKKLEKKTDTGRDNHEYDSEFDRQFRIATQRMVGDDPGYEAFVSRYLGVRSGLTPGGAAESLPSPSPFQLGGQFAPSQDPLSALLEQATGGASLPRSRPMPVADPALSPRVPGTMQGIFPQTPAASPSPTRSGPPPVPMTATGQPDQKKLMKGARYTYRHPETGATGIYRFDGTKLVREK